MSNDKPTLYLDIQLTKKEFDLIIQAMKNEARKYPEFSDESSTLFNLVDYLEEEVK